MPDSFYGSDLTLHFDGACEPRNPGGVATYSWVITQPDGSLFANDYGVLCRDCPDATNNRAEYAALGFALRYLFDEIDQVDVLRIFGDSKLVIEQVNGRWKCNAPKLIKLRDRCRRLLAALECRYTLAWVPRERNEAADALSRRAYEQATGRKFPSAGGRPMPELRAIETRYKGYRFRSRLEARFAVFLDALGMKWEYEKEGFHLPSGMYLPDFWIPYLHGQPGWGEWIEIKPWEPSAIEREKIADLVRLSGHRAFCLYGSPSEEDHRIDVFQHHHGGAPASIPLIRGASLVEFDHAWGDHFAVASSICVWPGLPGTDRGFSFPANQCDDREVEPGTLARAFKAARSARFEHGEAKCKEVRDA